MLENASHAALRQAVCDCMASDRSAPARAVTREWLRALMKNATEGKA